MLLYKLKRWCKEEEVAKTRKERFRGCDDVMIALVVGNFGGGISVGGGIGVGGSF